MVRGPNLELQRDGNARGGVEGLRRETELLQNDLLDVVRLLDRVEDVYMIVPGVAHVLVQTGDSICET